MPLVLSEHAYTVLVQKEDMPTKMVAMVWGVEDKGVLQFSYILQHSHHSFYTFNKNEGMNLVAIYNKQLISVADPDPIVPDPNKKLITRNRNGSTIPERTEIGIKKF